MKKNHIQLQKGLSLNQFIASYGTEELCGAFLEKSRWTEGYSCQKCGCAHPYVYWKKTVKVFQCSACRKQVTLTENTIFHSTKLSLVQWYQAMYEREITTKLSGSVEIDDAYFGGELRDGKVGRGFENQDPLYSSVPDQCQ